MIGVRECKENAVQTVQTCLELNPSSSHAVIKHIAKDGVLANDGNLALDIISITPQFIYEVIDDTNHAPVIEALFQNLKDLHLSEASVSSLKRYKEILTGKRNLEFYMRNIPDRQRKHFAVLCKKREEEHLTYGIFPSKVIKKLTDKGNSNVRAEASELLRHEVETSKDINEMVPHLKNFITFIGTYSEDTNFIVVTNILDTLLIVQRRLKNKISGHLKPIIKILMSVNTEAKIETKLLIYENVKFLMTVCQPQEVVDELLDYVGNKNARYLFIH